MSNQGGVVQVPMPQRRSLPTLYLEGAVPISIPKNHSTPVDESRRRSAPYVRLYTGPPIESDDENYAPQLSSNKVTRSKSSGRPKKNPQSFNCTRLSAPSLISVTSPASTALYTQRQTSHPYQCDSTETFAATRLESLIPLPFIASASDARQNAIQPPSAARPASTRYKILFNAAHALIMHQAVVNGNTQSVEQKKQFEELTRINYRQAKFILELQKENATLRGLTAGGGLKVSNTAPTRTSKKQKKKRKRNEREMQELFVYVNSLGNKVESGEQRKQLAEREKKMWQLHKQWESLLEDNEDDN